MAIAVSPVLSSGEKPGYNGRSKLLIFVLLSSFLFLVASAGEDTPAHGVVRDACSATLYPELCYSSFAAEPSMIAAVTDRRSVVRGAIGISKAAVQQTAAKVQKICSSKPGGLTKRETCALHDCLEVFTESLLELSDADNDLISYNRGASSKVLGKHAADLKTFLSAAMTNQESCLDGFNYDGEEKKLRSEFVDYVMHVSRLCSNALAMVSNMTQNDIIERMAVEEEMKKSGNRKLLQEEQAFEVDEAGWPTWMSAADRRLLQGSVTPNVVVAADGSGNFKTISAAVAAAPSGGGRYVIRIKAGTYNEHVDVTKKNIMFVGDGAGSTVITGSRNVVDGSTTFNSATVAAVGGGFLARDLTIQNTAGPSKHQAVALRVGSDLSAFYRCQILGYQDTLYVHSLRQFFRDCTIAGTVDFIFGNAAVVLQNCNIQLRNPNSGQKNTVTAQGRDDPNQNTGISIQGCSIGGSTSAKSYLGRPWRRYSRTMVMQSSISGAIDPAGWLPWSGNFALDTLTYREYQNTGAGAGTSNRVTWKGYKVASASEAQQYTVGNFIGGSGWLGATGFPFSLGL